jgi:hypothetical protein
MSARSRITVLSFEGELMDDIKDPNGRDLSLDTIERPERQKPLRQIGPESEVRGGPEKSDEPLPTKEK